MLSLVGICPLLSLVGISPVLWGEGLFEDGSKGWRQSGEGRTEDFVYIYHLNKTKNTLFYDLG